MSYRICISVSEQVIHFTLEKYLQGDIFQGHAAAKDYQHG